MTWLGMHLHYGLVVPSLATEDDQRGPQVPLCHQHYVRLWPGEIPSGKHGFPVSTGNGSRIVWISAA